MSRNLLHISKLEALKSWLIDKGYKVRPGRGDWQILQVCIDKEQWCCIFERLDMLEHFTVDHRLDGVVKEFIKESK